MMAKRLPFTKVQRRRWSQHQLGHRPVIVDGWGLHRTDSMCRHCAGTGRVTKWTTTGGASGEPVS